MTVLMFQKRFVEPIQSGAKSQTIRPKRKRPIKPGDSLSLRHWEDKAYRSPQVEFAKARAVGSFDIEICDSGIWIGLGSMRKTAAELDEFARADGFANWVEMRDFFTSRFGYGLPFKGTLIQWEAAS